MKLRTQIEDLNLNLIKTVANKHIRISVLFLFFFLFFFVGGGGGGICVPNINPFN